MNTDSQKALSKKIASRLTQPAIAGLVSLESGAITINQINDFFVHSPCGYCKEL